jgi:hypothetical protein
MALHALQGHPEPALYLNVLAFYCIVLCFGYDPSKFVDDSFGYLLRGCKWIRESGAAEAVVVLPTITYLLSERS